MSSLRFVLAFALLLGGGTAEAGALSKVVGGMKHASGQSGGGHHESSRVRDHRSSSSDSSSDSSPDYGSDGGDPDSNRHRHHHGHVHYPAAAFLVSAYPYPTYEHGTDVTVYFGLAAVEDSDGAMAMSLRASYGDLGLEIADTKYFERDERMPSDYLTMDVWTLGFAYRAVAAGADERTAIWLKGGLAGASSYGLSVLGAVGGAELAHNVSSTLGLHSSARLFAYQDGIRGVELRTGFAASIVRVSYRVLKFNVGPALRGPEVGVSLSF